MYGSIHTHFESKHDTANDLLSMCEEFKRLGCKKVAVTEHGVFSSYEDLRDLTDKMEDFEIIPGVEGYFGDEAAHIVLIAKNYQGYLSLCRIITDSNRNYIGEKPIITLENLQKNVSKGDVFCTTACIAGVFGRSLGLDRYNIFEKMKALEDIVLDSGYEKALELQEEQDTLTKLAKQKLVGARKNAEKAFKQYGNKQALVNIEQKEAERDAAIAELEDRREEFLENTALLKRLSAQGIPAKYKTYKKQLELYKGLPGEDQAFKRAKTLFNKMIAIFGKANFYFELQNHGLDSEQIIYNNIIKLAKMVGHERFIASNDIHVGCTKENEDKYRQEIIKRNAVMFTRFNTYNEISPDDWEYYIKTDDELSEWLSKIIEDKNIVSQAIDNIKVVLSQCHIEFPTGEQYYPKYCEDADAELYRQVEAGIKRRFPNGVPDERYDARLKYELDIITKMGYSSYHLIVADFLNYARTLGYLPDDMIPNAPLSTEAVEKLLKDRGIECIGYNIGPGRGSCVGSLACYYLGISDIDPIPYNLLFERFLNPERVSMPDVDSDYRPDIREKTIEYCKAKYGAEKICQIMTKQYGSIKGNLRLAARYLGSKEHYDTKSECKIDIYLKPWYTLADSLSKKVKDGELPEENYSDKEKAIIDLALSLDGVFLNYGQHAAGTIISSIAPENIIPLMFNSSKGNMETQCTMAQAEAKGLLKMDFLGLINLAIITSIMRRTKDNRLQDITLRESLLADKAVYEKIFATGLTHGVFQFESDGMKKMLTDFKPESFEDIILLVAAYRPGPLDYIPEITAAKWFNKFNGDFVSYERMIKKLYPFSKEVYEEKKAKNIAYFYDENGNLLRYVPHSVSLKNDTLDSILNATYGCPIYQEQIMQIFQKMAGYSLGGADVVRRYMSKKKEDKLAKEKKAFIFGDEERGIPGCMKLQGITEQEAEILFNQLMPFAKYGFNKSHATAYALVAFFTAFLKLYHPAEFFAESLNYISKLAEVAPFVKEMAHPAFGIKILPPSALNSENSFIAVDKSVRFGLSYIKGLSEVDFIRTANPLEFIDINYHLPVSVTEKLIKSGLFDDSEPNRQKLFTWFTENSEKIKDINKIKTKIDELADETELTEQEIIKKSNKLNEKLQCSKEQVESPAVYSHITSDIIKSRTWELEMLGCVFSTQKSDNIIKSQPEQLGFEVLQAGDARINATVISCSEEKKTKTSSVPYYEVTLRDRFGQEITRRFDKPITIPEGSFYLLSDEQKFFFCKESNAKLLRRRTFILKDELTAELYQMLYDKNGTISITDRKGLMTFYTTEEKLRSGVTEHGIVGFYSDFS